MLKVCWIKNSAERSGQEGIHVEVTSVQMVYKTVRLHKQIMEGNGVNKD